MIEKENKELKLEKKKIKVGIKLKVRRKQILN